MLDNIRRKLSHSNFEVFYNKRWDLGRFEDLIYYRGTGSALPHMRCTKKKTNESFWFIYKSLRIVKLKDVEINMIACSAGKFEMGDSERKYNNPQRQEVIERTFLLGETEITQELYEAVMGTNPSSFQNKPKNPVEMVSWYESILFSNELSKLQGLDECYILTDISRIDEKG